MGALESLTNRKYRTQHPADIAKKKPLTRSDFPARVKTRQISENRACREAGSEVKGEVASHVLKKENIKGSGEAKLAGPAQRKTPLRCGKATKQFSKKQNGKQDTHGHEF